MFFSGGYDENDVTFTWLRGNDSVHGVEKLRLSQYTVESYYTLVSKSQQETGKSGKERSKKSFGLFPPPTPFPSMGQDLFGHYSSILQQHTTANLRDGTKSS